MNYTTRKEWGAQHGRGNPTPGPQSGVVIHHDPLRHTTAASTVAQEIHVMRTIETHAARVLTPTNPRISYQWAVAASGRIYEGLGFNRIGAHVANANTPNLGIFFMKDGRTHTGTDAQWRAVSEIVREGIAISALVPRPELRSHRDLVATTCPGDALHAKVRSFTLDSLLALSGGEEDAPDRVGERVWSPFFRDWLIVTEYRSDRDWRFIRASEIAGKGSRAQTPLSQMPRAA
jgi:hypothetical protein